MHVGPRFYALHTVMHLWTTVELSGSRLCVPLAKVRSTAFVSALSITVCPHSRHAMA